MQLEEYHALERVEQEHWFYRGKRALVKWWIDREAVLSRGDLILDAGAGTGELVKELRECYGDQGVNVLGIEYEAEAREIASRTKGIQLRPGSILELPFADGEAAVTIAMDVLEHVEQDTRALNELLRVTRHGGIVIVNVPAFMSLWSEWDVTLKHYRRYSKAMLRDVLSHSQYQYEILYFGYTNVAAFLPIFLYRKLAKIFKFKNRAEDNIPSHWLNTLLYKLYLVPSRKLWFSAPFGSSLFCVLQRK